MADSGPPPMYDENDPSLHTPTVTASVAEPQILIIPPDGVNFQTGFLGADGERAAIEGEVQIKSADPAVWEKVIMILRTVESAYGHEIELAGSEAVLFMRSQTIMLPSSLPFSLPLTPDTPQSIETHHSSLNHKLTVVLHPSPGSCLSPVSKSLVVHTRRFSSHNYTPSTSPETHSLRDPTLVEVQVPRTTFLSGEPVPIYVTVPSPDKSLVADNGIRLRNVKAELVRSLMVKQDVEGEYLPEQDPGPSTFAQSSSPKPAFIGTSFHRVIAHSGASCRFHSSRPVQLRFVLHQGFSTGATSDSHTGSMNDMTGDAETASITQTTLLHSVSFCINIHVSFVDTTNRTERISTLTIPVIVLPPLATLPEVPPSMDEAYQKKHDRPPIRTVRMEDDAPQYSQMCAGPSSAPSYLAGPSGAPPPFEEREAPPPFSAQASTSHANHLPPFSSNLNYLPTFIESENEIIIPSQEDTASFAQPELSPPIPGEGVEFGFFASQQFDGHSDDVQRATTPPPTLEMAMEDTNLTQLTDIREPERAAEALSLVLDQHQDVHEPPPPPPAMDDPSDPPPTIDDSQFRSPHHSNQVLPVSSSPCAPPSLSLGHAPSPPPPLSGDGLPIVHENGHAPPPYRVPHDHDDRVSATARPPPYVD